MNERDESTLPLFPLALVLVPGELLPLHVFEERYKSLMRDALEDDRRFGLSYVTNAEVGEPGCTRWQSWFRLTISGGCP